MYLELYFRAAGVLVLYSTIALFLNSLIQIEWSVIDY